LVPAPPQPAKDTERQLSKKELKKKELAELDAVLAELGLSGNNSKNEEGNSFSVCIFFCCEIIFHGFPLFMDQMRRFPSFVG
jgi:hypothetical protein